MTSDLDLLKSFTQKNSQDAFATLVSRHLNLVYSAALRQVRSPQLAEEVAQSVFTDLATHAAKLKPDTILTAWLYQVTRRTAIDVVRREARRQLREQVALEMNAMNATAADWTNIEPILDEAIAALDESGRTAILLRYFENKSFRDVGQQLGVSDDTAQKRVSRAVERLREVFSRRHVTIGATGLVIVISARAVQAAPANLAATISTVTFTGTTATATATAIKIIAMTTLQKTLITTIIAAAVGAGIYEVHRAGQAPGPVQSPPQDATQTQPHPAAAPDASVANPRFQERRQAIIARVDPPVAVPVESDTNLQPVVSNTVPIVLDQSLPKDSWTNAGFATPEDTLRTRGWAILNSDRERFADAISITPGARKLIEDTLVKMAEASTDPDRDRILQEVLKNKWGAEDALFMPMLGLNQQDSFTSYDITAAESPSADTQVLTVVTKTASATTVHETLRFKLFGNDWKILVDEDAVKAAQQ